MDRSMSEREDGPGVLNGFNNCLFLYAIRGVARQTPKPSHPALQCSRGGRQSRQTALQQGYPSTDTTTIGPSTDCNNFPGCPGSTNGVEGVKSRS